MNDRIEKLRRQSLEAKPAISIERARLLTEFYRTGEAERVSVPVARALAFAYLLRNKEICINDGELIVGERGPAPKATPTYPEICIHTLADFEILSSREKISFQVDQEAKDTQEEISLFDAMDRMKIKYGSGALMRASTLEVGARHRHTFNSFSGQ